MASLPPLPPGGRIKEQTAYVRFRAMGPRAFAVADLHLIYQVEYHLDSVAAAKQWVRKVIALGWPVKPQILDYFEQRERSNVTGLPFGLDYRAMIPPDRQRMMQLVGNLRQNASQITAITFKVQPARSERNVPEVLIKIAGGLGGSPAQQPIIFREHAQGIYDMAKRLGIKVRASGKLSSLVSVLDVRRKLPSKALPPIPPGGQFGARTRLQVTAANSEMLDWLIYVSINKFYDLKDQAALRAFIALARRSGYKLLRSNEEGNADLRIPHGEPRINMSKDQLVEQDIATLRKNFPLWKTHIAEKQPRGIEYEIQVGKMSNDWWKVDLVRQNGGPRVWAGGMLLKTAKGLATLRAMARQLRVPVVGVRL